MKNTKGLMVILGTGIIISSVLVASNFNVEININSKGEQVSTNQPVDQMHGAGQPTDAAVFNSLLGKSAPDFTLETYNGSKVALSSLKGKNVVLFFNEGLMCYPACWNQIAAFGKDEALKNKSVILNITADPKNDWKQAIAKMPELAQALVLFDSNRQVSSAYGVLTLPSSMHKGQFPGHSYVIVDKEGIVKFIRDDVSMAIRNQELGTQIDKL